MKECKAGQCPPDDSPAMREGYCCDCANLDLSLVLTAKEPGNPCNGCWFTDDKPNWASRDNKPYFKEDGMLMNADGSRSIFDDIDA